VQGAREYDYLVVAGACKCVMTGHPMKKLVLAWRKKLLEKI
jgi:hypothetical protein